MVPSSLTAQIISTAHETHSGIMRTKVRLCELFWWLRMDEYVEAAVKNCNICLKADKSTRTSLARLQLFEWPKRPWQKLALTIVGSLERTLPSQQQICHNAYGLPLRVARGIFLLGGIHEDSERLFNECFCPRRIP